MAEKQDALVEVEILQDKKIRGAKGKFIQVGETTKLPKDVAEKLRDDEIVKIVKG